jgi:hypothetical protein
MPIDGCLHDFPTLTAMVLPARMKVLEVAMTAPLPMSAFSTAGVGVRSLVKQHGHEKDFSGCYVLIDKEPIYVGISRTVFARLRQHVTGTTHSDGSLAYLMAKKDAPHEKTRAKAMKEPAFAKIFAEKRAYLRTLGVATVAIENPVELHIFEVYAALTFRTATWNSFRTH